MGIIKFFRQLRAMHKLLKELPAEIERQQAAYREMTPEEMASLANDELFSAACARTEAKIDAEQELSVSFAGLNAHQKVLYALNLFEMEVNNGGLCQFFVNSSQVVAPYISEYLGLIGAETHKQLFDGFITKYQVNLSDLSSFRIRRMKDYEKQTQRYPFDEFDDHFYEMESLEEPLTAYVRAHADAF